MWYNSHLRKWVWGNIIIIWLFNIRNAFLKSSMVCKYLVVLFMEIFQARILEWIAMPSSRGSSEPRDWTQVSHITGRSLKKVSWGFSVLCCDLLSGVWFFATLYNPLPGCSVHEIFQARMLEWMNAISFSRGSSQPKDQILSSVSPTVQADALPMNHQGSLEFIIKNF